MSETKNCSNCNKVKYLTEFNKNNSTHDGYSYHCKECRKQYNLEHKEERRKYRKETHKLNKEKENSQSKLYYKKNKSRLYQEKQQRNIETNYSKEYYKKNKEKILKRTRNYAKRRRHTNIEFNITCNLRRRFHQALKTAKKSTTTLEILGCTIEECRKYLETQFTEGMSWDNYGRFGWHIDHIRPCASFDLTDPEQQKECFHYTNLQPLWAKDNLLKSDKWEEN